MKLSIVTTLYQSAAYIQEFYQRATNVAQELVEDDYEIIFVNDGSPDNSLEIAISLCEIDSHIKLIDLSRNFGHHKAMMTGLSHSIGDHTFLIDSDLEEEPEWLISFSEELNKGTCDVVYGVQKKRKGNLFERWSGQVFYKGFNAITGLELPHNMITARLMSRRYVNALLKHKEREIFIAGLWLITGFVQKPQIIRKHSTSNTTYTLGSKLSLLVNAITSFSNKPLIGIFYLGVIISIIAGSYTAFLLVNKLFLSTALSGWTSVMVSIWFLSGLLISSVGVVGIYLSKMFSEIKQRPNTIVRKLYGDITNDDLNNRHENPD